MVGVERDKEERSTGEDDLLSQSTKRVKGLEGDSLQSEFTPMEEGGKVLKEGFVQGAEQMLDLGGVE